MSLSTHYFVLSLGGRTTMLFEAFRDSLIHVENRGFPVEAPAGTPPLGDNQLQELARTIDTCFGHYYVLEPLRLVVVGVAEMLAAFRSMTTHAAAIIGEIEGDHTATSPRDLGQIVWPVVREAMSGALDSALRDIEASAERGRATSGLEAVTRLVYGGQPGTLLVESDYHVRGRIGGTSRSPVIVPDVDVRDAMDDAVDVIIERVLAIGGNVVFTPGGSLTDRNRMVFLLQGEGGE